jgi:hypothetical protein
MIIVLSLHFFNDLLLKIFITDSISLQAREQIINKSMEKRYIIKYEFGHVHITKSSHQHDILTDVSVCTLELTGHHKHRLDSSQSEVIMVLLGKLLLRELVKHGHFLGEDLGHSETLRHKHVLANEEQVGLDHGNWSEESLQVVGELGTTSITWVHCNVDTHGRDQAHISVQEVNLLLTPHESLLNSLNLSGDDREHLSIDTVELIEATPETSLNETRENNSHSNEVQVLTAIGDDATQCE